MRPISLVIDLGLCATILWEMQGSRCSVQSESQTGQLFGLNFEG